MQTLSKINDMLTATLDSIIPAVTKLATTYYQVKGAASFPVNKTNGNYQMIFKSTAINISISICTIHIHNLLAVATPSKLVVAVC